MSDFLSHMMFAYLALFPILNPPAMAPVFLSLTAGVDEAQRNTLAARIGFYTAVFLTVLLLVGGWILKGLGISIPVIAIAGGLLLFHSAWHMLNRDTSMSEDEKAELQGDLTHKAFFPFTLPVTAGPGAMAVTLSLVPRAHILQRTVDGTRLDWGVILHFAALSCGIALAGLTVFLFYRFFGPIIRRIGATGAATVNQLSAFVLLAIGVQIIWGGVKDLIQTLP